MRVEEHILLSRDGLIVVDKPAGWPSTGRDLDDPDCVQHRLMTHLRRRKVWAVHQLDADTTGLNLFVTRKALVAAWAKMLSDSEKEYRAICHGRIDANRFDVDQPIGWVDGDRRRWVSSGGKPARSRFEVLARTDAHSELSVRIETGRSHQIRIHLAWLNHPLVGERRYREPACEVFPRHALHAHRIRFSDGLELCTELPADFVGLRRGLGLR